METGTQLEIRLFVFFAESSYVTAENMNLVQSVLFGTNHYKMCLIRK